jgi:hypothetical protein
MSSDDLWRESRKYVEPCLIIFRTPSGAYASYSRNYNFAGYLSPLTCIEELTFPEVITRPPLEIVPLFPKLKLEIKL